MKLASASICIACAAVAACASSDALPQTGFTVTLRPNQQELKHGNVFQLDFTKTKHSIDREELHVGLSVPGEVEFLLPWDQVRDLNGNDLIDAGDTVQVTAPIMEVVDMIESNTELNVTVLLPFEGGHRQVWSGIWLRSE